MNRSNICWLGTLFHVLCFAGVCWAIWWIQADDPLCGNTTFGVVAKFVYSIDICVTQVYASYTLHKRFCKKHKHARGPYPAATAAFAQGKVKNV